nr:MAG TPA: hypothetical protein [Caudoviricetes sp.]
MIKKNMDAQQLKAVCDVLAETNLGYTKTELTRLLEQSEIGIVPDGKQSNGYVYQMGLNKREWLYNCLAMEVNKSHSLKRVYSFIEKALNPVAFTDERSRDKYNFLFEGTNKVLLLAGLEITKEGKIIEVVQAKTLDEVDRRVNSLQRQLYNRAIHSEVKKYCIKDYLQKDYYDAVFEAAKGLAQRVRDITGLTTDGGTLFQTAFSKNDPYLFFNSMKTDSEISEFIGLKELIEAIFHLVRNPVAHTPKINWKVDEDKALDILTVISFAHKYLDECHKMPKKI